MSRKNPRSKFQANSFAWLSGWILLGQCHWLLAENSVWYRSDDPLKTEVLAPPAIPAGYLDSTACKAIDHEKVLTLSDVAETALCNNPQTRAAFASARVQAAQVGIVQSAYLPSVTDNLTANLNFASPANARSNPYGNLGNNLLATYLLYDFGNRKANLENARQLLQAASATQSSVVQNVLLSAIQAYFQVQAGIAALDAARETERASEESFKAANARYTTGMATPADKLLAQTQYAQNTLTRITAEGTLKTAYGTLANVMGLAANSTLKLSPSQPVQAITHLDQDIEALIEQARVRRPDLIASEAQLKAAQASIDASRASAKPTVSVSLSNGFQDGNDVNSSNNTALGMTVSIPLFSGFAPTYRIRSAQGNAEVRAAQRDQLRLQISLDVWSAYQNLRTANQAVTAAEALLSSAEQSARMTLGRYKAGVGNVVETLNAQGALATARQQKIQAGLNWNIARASLAQAMGGLDHAMLQSLPEENKPMANTEKQP